jgi:hypothetical protein
MIEVKDLLNKFENILLSETNKRECLRRAVSEALGQEIELEKVKIKGNTAYLDLKPLYKNEIFLKQEKILERLRELPSGKNPPLNIR